MVYVNLILSIALLLGVINVHIGIVLANHYHNGMYGLLNWGMAFILFMTAIQKICEYSF
jgi:hypothetical protein